MDVFFIQNTIGFWMFYITNSLRFYPVPTPLARECFACLNLKFEKFLKKTCRVKNSCTFAQSFK